ncbi:DUF1573 domain-containing protein [Limibacter armeniacum]|uniref:DUF1573 domain-containing protein n=1 Tax=Limibacter armeniacum TaxID=466084 RepID=UPI002FE54AC6
MRKLLFTVFLAFLSTVTHAQGVFVFDAIEYNFGEILESDTVSYSFRFTNHGNQPIIISEVAASCGCTTPSWSKEPVLPGETGQITTAFTSEDNEGHFVKTISIFSNALIPKQYLKISGDIVEEHTDSTNVAHQIDNDQPFLQLKELSANFGTINVGETVTKAFTVVNAGKEPLKITSVYSKCQCLTYSISSAEINSGESAKLEIYYTPKKTGYMPEYVKIDSNHRFGIQMIRLDADIVNPK